MASREIADDSWKNPSTQALFEHRRVHADLFHPQGGNGRQRRFADDLRKARQGYHEEFKSGIEVTSKCTRICSATRSWAT